MFFQVDDQTASTHDREDVTEQRKIERLLKEILEQCNNFFFA
jgi:hypothetical protein